MTGKKRTILTIVSIIILAVLIVVLGTVMRQKEALKTPTSNTTYAMGTVVSQNYYCGDSGVGSQAVKEITSIINDLDNKISLTKDSTQIISVNEVGNGCVSKEVYNCIKTCVDVSTSCDGAFDITVGNLSSLWSIGTDHVRLPSVDEISSALSTINYKSIALKTDKNDFSVTIGSGQKLDLGSVGKGLACDEALKYLKTTTIKGATVSVGGSVLIYGENPTSDDGSWNIGVRDPKGTESDYMAVINTTGGFFSTSGDYEKTFDAPDGKTYHHILDPKTGYSAESNITGITIYANSGIVSDALSTACFILGYGEESLNLLKEYNAEALFITKDNKVYITDGLKNSVTIVDDTYEVVA